MSDAATQPQPPTVDPLIYQLVRQVTYLPLLLSGSHLEIHGREHIPPAGSPLILASNHRTALDPFVLARGVPPESGRFVQFMAKSELFVPGIGEILRRGGTFPVDRDGQDVGSVRTALRILKANGTLGIFPEGTRSGGQMHGGVVLLALKGRAPVVPGGIWHSGARWVLRLGPPISPSRGSKALLAELESEILRLSQPDFGQLWE
ncbi:lysophospholipid acyltransferase family protein [Deinococcus sp. Marseille-Q6407]|uniref:lysophospholipid acyltransferase family protein n=1 Tax=Deinococcus sp. Marseille-Q6407 TaxID=2969223 RepID=UPI0021C0CC44|nr:lysophospholipid acyltransferase family protein [Deinococcus sp. Marseille-Q6407]